MPCALWLGCSAAARPRMVVPACSRRSSPSLNSSPSRRRLPAPWPRSRRLGLCLRLARLPLGSAGRVVFVLVCGRVGVWRCYGGLCRWVCCVAGLVDAGAAAPWFFSRICGGGSRGGGLGMHPGGGFMWWSHVSMLWGCLARLLGWLGSRPGWCGSRSRRQGCRGGGPGSRCNGGGSRQFVQLGQACGTGGLGCVAARSRAVDVGVATPEGGEGGPCKAWRLAGCWGGGPGVLRFVGAFGGWDWRMALEARVASSSLSRRPKPALLLGFGFSPLQR